MSDSDTISVETSEESSLRIVLAEDPEIETLVARSTIQISNDDHLGVASDLLKELKMKRDHILALHKSEKKPHLEAGRAVDRKYRLPKSLLVKAIEVLGDEMDTYIGPLNEQSMEAALADDAWLADETARVKKLRNETGADIPFPTPRVPKKAPKRVVTGMSRTSFVKKKRFRLPEVEVGNEKNIDRTDPRVANIPDHFFKLDPVEIRKAKERGEHIPNVEEFTHIRPVST